MQVKKIAVVNKIIVIVFEIETGREIGRERDFVAKPAVLQQIEAPRRHLGKTEAGQKIPFPVFSMKRFNL